MAWDLPQTVMAATVEVEAPLPDGRHTIGTGFLINDPTPDGKPRIVLVTANHVFDRMPGAEAHVGYRVQDKDGGWRYDPQPIAIRDGKTELWRHDPAHDVAVIAVKAPPAFAKAAIPLSWLAGGDAFAKYGVGPGDEMMVLGYPQGLSANSAGFPILRSGRVASPIEAASANPTFLLDFHVFPGNSGGPVFLVPQAAAPTGTIQVSTASQPAGFIAGMLTQQVELNNERLEIGIVTDAEFVRDAIALLDEPRAAIPSPVPAPVAAPIVHDVAVSARVGHPVAD
jgi:S1-C subfamily serine protease